MRTNERVGSVPGLDRGGNGSSMWVADRGCHAANPIRMPLIRNNVRMQRHKRALPRIVGIKWSRTNTRRLCLSSARIYAAMTNSDEPWQAAAAAKREAILNSIPESWRLPSIPTAEQQPDVTGPYIQQFLGPKEVEITETDAVGIIAKTSSGAWTAVEVAEAFCHRASIGHQLVTLRRLSQWRAN